MAISSNTTGLRPGVCTSTTRPTSPYEGQHIYETDTDLVYLWNGSAWVEVISALTKAPRGIVAIIQNGGSGAVSLPAATNTTVLTAPSFTAVANRYYRITWQEPEINAGTGTIQLKLQNGATVLMNKSYSGSPVYIAGIVTTVTTFSAGSVTITAIANPTTNGSVYRSSGGYIATLVIEDIGSV